MHKFSLFSFFSVFLLMYFGGHYYIYNRIVNGMCLTAVSKYSLLSFFCLASLSFFLTRFFPQNILTEYFRPVAYFGNIWVGVAAISVSVFFIRDLIRIFFRGDNFSYYSTVSCIIIIGLISVYSFYNVRRGVAVKEIKIKTDKLPEGIDNFSVVQISDLHLDYLSSGQWLEKVVEQTNVLSPDLIVITGDTIERGIDHRDDFSIKLKRLSSRYGVFGILGNHEYYTGLNTFFRFAGQSNIKILRNEKVTIDNFIELVGLDDKTGKQFGETAPGIENLFKTVDDKKLVIVLAHRPDAYKDILKFGFDLQLSGHTHAGQIPPGDLIVRLYYKYPYGLYSLPDPKKGKNSFIYTTSGTGTWAPPLRLFSRSEIVKIIFER
ncbi:MAG: metallophosphoesterase [bacterium]|nr:metallophosphoesterase [bacterium]